MKSTTAALASSWRAARPPVHQRHDHAARSRRSSRATRRPSRTIASSRRQVVEPETLRADRRRSRRGAADGAPTTSQIHQSLRPKSSQPARRLTSARADVGERGSRRRTARPRDAPRAAADAQPRVVHPAVFAVRIRQTYPGRPAARRCVRSRAWSSAHSGGAASPSRGSSSAAATSAASARRRRSSARGRRARRRSGCSTPRGTWGSRRSTRPTRTAAGAARSTSAPGSGRRGPRCATAS